MATATAERQENRVSDDLIDAARNVDLVALAERYTTLRREAAREFAGPCPRCGGADRFHVSGAGWWFCRQCHEERGDSITLLQWLQPGLGFREAVAQLTGSGITSVAPPAQRQRVQHRRQDVQPPEWRQTAGRIAIDAMRLLWAPEGAAAREYLAARALDGGTALQYEIGYRPDAPLPGTHGRLRAPAIVLPWRSGGRGGPVYALRYRFLEVQQYEDSEGKPRAEKLVAETGSQFSGRLFGGQMLPEWLRVSSDQGAERYRWLLVVEGEINAMSVWQAAGESDLDVLSIGSESAAIPSGMAALAARYGRAMVWADRAEVAQRLMAALPGAYGVKSPGGRDANDLLRSGHLGGFLATVRVYAATGPVELERLLWALWDAAGLPGGIDAGSAAVLRSLAAKLGKTAPVAEPEPGRWVQAEKVAP